MTVLYLLCCILLQLKMNKEVALWYCTLACSACRSSKRVGEPATQPHRCCSATGSPHWSLRTRTPLSGTTLDTSPLVSTCWLKLLCLFCSYITMVIDSDVYALCLCFQSCSHVTPMPMPETTPSTSSTPSGTICTTT